MGIALVAVGGMFILTGYVAVVTAMLHQQPDPVVNIARCLSCGAATFQSVVDDINRKPPLCSDCTPAGEGPIESR